MDRPKGIKHAIFNFHTGVEERLSKKYSDDEVLKALEEIGLKIPSKLSTFQGILPEDNLVFDEKNELHMEIKKQLLP